MEVVQLNTDWEDVSCPICLDFPHNSVLLQCSSYEKGCRPFVCDTDHLHSNCLDRFKSAHGMLSASPLPSTSNATSIPIESTNTNNLEATGKPICPLCRGEVTGWVVVKMAREHLDEKKRCCEEEQCAFMGTYDELREHAQLEHPHARPSKIDPARQLDWENFQQSSEIIDVLSTIHSEVPRGVVLGDYVIEYGDDDSGDDFEDFPGDEGNWWTSCILYQVFDNFRTSRNRRRSRASESRRGSHRLSYDTSNSDEGSVTSTEDEFVSTIGLSRSRADHHRFPIMFSSSQFDGNFNFSQSSQATDSGVSPAKNRDAPGTIPVTVKKIIEASQSGDEKSNFLVAGVDVSNVSVVAMVTRKVERVTDVGFTLDDGTGRIDCNRWVNEGYDTKEMSVIQDGIYVRVNGRLRSFQGKKQIVVFSVRPVTNFDEITYHFIECIHFHLQNSRVQLQGDTSTQSEINPALNTPSQKGINGSNAYQASVPNLSVDGLKGFDQMVLDYLQRPSSFGSEKGVHRDVIHQELKIPLEKLMESIHTLEEEGLIYSTIDEFHYKSTTSD